MRTGDSCERTAIYRSGCPCAARITIAIGTPAPVCPICQRTCNWSLGPESVKTPERARTRTYETRRRNPSA